MKHTVESLMAIADAYAISVADAPHHPTPLLRAMAVEKIERAREALHTALTDALAQPVRERKVMSKVFCNQNQFDGEELAYSHDYLNE